MPTSWAEADTVLDLLNNLWIGMVAILVIAIPLVIGKRHNDRLKGIQGETRDIRDQVVNGHADAPPLRADVDRVLRGLESLTVKVDGMAQDIREEREERRTNIDHLRKDLDGRLQLINDRIGH